MSFEVGDKVVSLIHGHGVVTEATDNTVTIKVCSTDRQFNYYPDGRYYVGTAYTMLYHAENFTPPSCNEPERKPKYEFKPFDKVLVRDDKKQIWQPDIFAYLEPDAATPFICIGNMWAFCIPYEGNEDKCGRR